MSWKQSVILRGVCLFAFCGSLSLNHVQATIVRFSTTAGNIDFRFYDAATPLSVANFLQYVNSNRYDGTFIHRRTSLATSGVAVIQGGGFHLNNSIFLAATIPNFGTVMNEPGISNIRGTLSYAKGANPNSATSQWFINVLDNTVLDTPDNGSFTVFARVIGNSMSIVDDIYELPLINASVAQNAPGEDFDEIPVFNVAKVQSQGDIRNDDAVFVTSIDVRNLPAGDYNFDGTVNQADLAVWRADYGSITKAEADGNGNGRVDGDDFLIWQRTYGQTSSLNAAIFSVPEPTTICLAAMCSAALLSRRRCRK